MSVSDWFNHLLNQYYSPDGLKKIKLIPISDALAINMHCLIKYAKLFYQIFTNFWIKDTFYKGQQLDANH